MLCCYASHLADNNLAPQTIKLYFAAVWNVQIAMGLPDPREHSSLPLLKRIQTGISRLHAQKGLKQRIRLPITAPLLRQIKSALEHSESADRVTWWAICCTAFFGFFRLGELLVDKPTAFCQATDLAWGNVSLDNQANPRMICIHLKKSKTDQFGKGSDVVLGWTDKDLCPVAALLNFVIIWGTQPGPLFIDSKKEVVTKSRFIAELRNILRALGLPQDDYAGHSFRIGAATSASLMGMEDSVIQILGRWRSDAFLRYIHTPREQLATMSAELAR